MQFEHSSDIDKCYSYKIIIPQSEQKEETVEEAAERIFTPAYTNYKVRRQGFIEGAKWQKERMYSEEDMFAFLDWSKSSNQEKLEYELKCLLSGTTIDSKILFSKWFKQIKK